MSKEKSILSNVPVDESNWKPYRRLPLGGSSTGEQLEIVGSCPQCGSPVYGNKVVSFKDLKSQMPVVFHSCTCSANTKSFADQIQTK